MQVSWRCPVIAGLVLFVIGTASLYACYYTTSSMPFIYEYRKLLYNIPVAKNDPKPVGISKYVQARDMSKTTDEGKTYTDISERYDIGAYIEFALLVTLIPITMYLIGGIFRREWRDIWLSFLGLFTRGRESAPRDRTLICLVVALLFSGVVSLVVYDHWKMAPSDLAHHWVKDQALVAPMKPVSDHSATAFYRNYRLPYLLYLPYSLVIYMFLILPLFVSVLRSVALDKGKLQGNRRKLLVMLRLPPPPDGSEVRREFNQFYSYFVDTFGRYSILLFCVVVIITYENLLGRYVLSIAGIIWAYFAALVFGTTLLGVLLLFTTYESVFRKTYFHLTQIATVQEAGDFCSQFCAVSIVKNMIRMHLLFAISVFTLALNFPGAAEFIKKIAGLFG